jgi:hypothetical protein
MKNAVIKAIGNWYTINAPAVMKFMSHWYDLMYYQSLVLALLSIT